MGPVALHRPLLRGLPLEWTNIAHAGILQRIFRENKARIKRTIKHLEATANK
jgi:hypothetical protein